MSGLIVKRHHRKIQEPQLAAMVDVFSLLIVFLVMGTVFNSASLALPDSIKLPFSDSKETIEVAHQVIIGPTEIDFNFLGKKINREMLERDDEDPQLVTLKNEIATYLKNQPKNGKETFTLDVLADQQIPYRHIFNVVKFCREAGYQSVLFITMGK